MHRQVNIDTPEYQEDKPRVLFCNIAWMKFYDHIAFPEDKPRHGGSFVNDTGSAFECWNFHRYEDGYFGVQDYALFAKAVRYLKTANIQEVLLKYRKHTTNASNQEREMCLESERVKDEMIDFLTFDEKEKRLLYDKFALPMVSFIKRIFSIENVQNLKVIRILGINIKIYEKDKPICNEIKKNGLIYDEKNELSIHINDIINFYISQNK